MTEKNLLNRTLKELYHDEITRGGGNGFLRVQDHPTHDSAMLVFSLVASKKHIEKVLHSIQAIMDEMGAKSKPVDPTPEDAE